MIDVKQLVKSLLIGFTVSIVMLNLGVAMGILSGRGVVAGMLSAGLIAMITAAFGGTRIQGSGPTAPMSTLTAVIIAKVAEGLPDELYGVTADQFLTVVILMSAALLVLFALLRIGRLITFVPRLVISGFMCGIALIIIELQLSALFGWGREPLSGPLLKNIGIALATLGMTFCAPLVLKTLSPRLTAVPGSLVALITISLLAAIMMQITGLTVEMLPREAVDLSLSGLIAQARGLLPDTVTPALLTHAFPFALELAALCMIDTLLTALIVDRMTGTQTKRGRELGAQGLAMAVVGLVGGVPGAQSTVPSVLTVKEGAKRRLAGISAGVFVLVNMFLLQDLLVFIPKAVIVGILLRVAFDVFDVKPFLGFSRTLKRRMERLPVKILRKRELAILSGAALVTAFLDLILAVGVFTLGFYILNRLLPAENKLKDVVPD